MNTGPDTPMNAEEQGARPQEYLMNQNVEHKETDPMSSTSTIEYNGAATPEPAREGTRLRTVVWGLVLILLGAVVIAIGLGARLDPATVFIGILAIAGATLLVGALVSAARGRPKN